MIYVLLLEKGKFYVGFTERKDGERFTEHYSGKGAKWTKEYPIKEVIEWREGSLEDENKVTLEYMKKYGWTNVRGGSWCNVKMTKPPAAILKELDMPLSIEELKSKANKKECGRCGRSNHETSACYATSHVDGSRLDEEPEEQEEDIVIVPEPKTKKTVKCYRCGRFGHVSTVCYAKTHLDGHVLD